MTLTRDSIVRKALKLKPLKGGSVFNGVFSRVFLTPATLRRRNIVFDGHPLLTFDKGRLIFFDIIQSFRQIKKRRCLFLKRRGGFDEVIIEILDFFVINIRKMNCDVF